MLRRALRAAVTTAAQHSQRGRRAFSAGALAATAACAAVGCASLAGAEGRSRDPASSDLARHIDHTLLKPAATLADIHRLCDEALKFGFHSVCVNPVYVGAAKAYLQRRSGHSVKVCAVVGFPLGANTTLVKAVEAATAIQSGADEIDMVLPIGPLVDGNDAYVINDIRTIATVCHASGKLCKVILETSMLTDEQKAWAVMLAVHAGADYVKTSTGFGGGGATEHDVRLMAGLAGHYGVKVKASGGVRTRAQAEAVLRAGADRIGTSNGVHMCSEDGPAGGAGSY